MDREVLIGIVAVFASGCGVGVGATLFGIWAKRRLSLHSRTPLPFDGHDSAMLHRDLGELFSSIQELHERLDFHERVLEVGRTRKELDHSGQQALST